MRTAAAVLAAAGLLAPLPARGEPPAAAAAGSLLHEIERLSRTARVLYVAAHPDDENTALIAWLVGARGVDVAYLSLTRGGGGQNLVGTEQAELLGVVRTLELLEARRIDGATQRFTRARDFGYSKTSEEALAVWGRERTLADVVRAVRAYRPDVIVTRFDTSGSTHGHHTASAILAEEAFAAAADAERFAELGLPPWQAHRLVRNVSTWRLPQDADLSAYLAVDVGGFSPLLGRSWGEIAAASRTMHKSQGFGAAPERGPRLEHLEPRAGAAPEADLLDGVPLGWERFEGTEALAARLAEAARGFDPKAPERVLPVLARAHAEMAALPPGPRRDAKLAALEQVMRDAAGLWLAVRAPSPAAVRGQRLDVELHALNRSAAAVSLRSVTLPDDTRIALDAPLAAHGPLVRELTVRVPDGAPLAIPHWLRGDVEDAFYGHDAAVAIGSPDTPPPLPVRVDLEVSGVPMRVVLPLGHVRTDRVRGEVERRVEVLPPVTVSADADVLLLVGDAPATLRATVEASAGPAAGRVRVETAPGWRAEPAAVPFELAGAGARAALTVELRAPADEATASPGWVRLVPETRGAAGAAAAAERGFRIDRIEHPHLPERAVLREARVRLVPLDIAGTDRRIAYVPGSGDLVAEGLRQVGYEVVEVDAAALASASGGAALLAGFDAVVTGIRAYNVAPDPAGLRAALLAHARGGGLVLTQYNTHSEWSPLATEVGPYPLTLGRGRVTDETAPMVPVDPEHPVLTTPNRLVAEDFAGWVQERGLYFAESWDPRYEPVFRIADPGEEPLEGGVLVAAVGEGAFVYTGLAFFRQLPAGVPGAYRLLANLLAWRP